MNIAALFASLGIKIDERSFEAGEEALLKMQRTAEKAMHAASQAKFHFDHITSGKGHGSGPEDPIVDWGDWEKESKEHSERFKKRWESVTGGIAKAAKFAFGVVAGVVATGALVHGIGTLGDAYNSAASRIRQMTDDTEKQKFAQDSLFQSANEIGVSYESQAKLFQQVGKAALDTGRSFEQGVKITQTLSKAIQASGADAAGADAALTQLAQGLGSGTLRGDEFNSVLEQTPAVIDLIAKHMGKTRGEMRKLAEGGALTSKVILSAIESSGAAVDEAFSKRIPQVGDLFNRLKNEMQRAFGEMLQDKDTMEGLTAAFAGFTKVLIAFIQGFAATVKFFSKHTGVLVALIAAITGALVTLAYQAAVTWAVLLGPWALLAAGIALIVYEFEDLVTLFFVGFVKIAQGVKWLGGLFVSMGRGIKRAFFAVGSFFASIARSVKDAFVSVFHWIGEKIEIVLSKLKGAIAWLKRNTVGRVEDLIDAGGDLIFGADQAAAGPPSRSLTPGARGDINIGDTTIQVNAPNADANAVADAVDAKQRAFWQRQMRDAQAGVGE